MSSPKQKKICEHQKIQNVIDETDMDLDKFWEEIMNSSKRKCSVCYLALVRKIKFEAHEDVPNDFLCREKIAILYQAIISGFLNVVNFIVKTVPEAFFFKAHSCRGTSILQVLFTNTNNEEIHNIFLDDEVFKKCVRVSSDLKNEDDSDLVFAIVNEEKCSRNFVEKLVKHTLEYEPSEIGQKELELVVKVSLDSKKTKHLDIVLQNNQRLLHEVWSNDSSFIHELVAELSNEFIEEMYEKYRPNLTVSNSKGTIFHKLMNAADMDFTLIDLIEKILIWEPRLSAIPRDSDGMTPLHSICHRFYMSLESNQIGHLLIEKYAVDVNTLDSKGNPPLYYAARRTNIDMIVYLLEHNAKTDNLTEDLTEIGSNFMENNDRLRITEGVVEMVKNVIDGSGNLETFNTVIYCLVKVKGHRVKNLPLKPLSEISVKDPTLVELFYKTCLTLTTHIFNFNDIKNFVKTIIEMNGRSPLNELNFAYNIFISFTTIELDFQQFDRSPDLYYKQKGFQSMKEFISIRNFNSICQGREMPTLKHLCRSVIRKQVFNNLNPENRKIPIDLFETLDIPICLKEYLCFLDNVPFKN